MKRAIIACAVCLLLFCLFFFSNKLFSKHIETMPDASQSIAVLAVSGLDGGIRCTLNAWPDGGVFITGNEPLECGVHLRQRLIKACGKAKSSVP